LNLKIKDLETKQERERENNLKYIEDLNLKVNFYEKRVEILQAQRLAKTVFHPRTFSNIIESLKKRV
jgi:hypothetical protein